MSHDQYQSIILNLQECVQACNHCYDACLQEDDVKMMRQCIRLDRECADICALLAQALSRGTPFAGELASVCAKICEACGMECKKHQHVHCQRCAEACFKCAEACKQLTG
ncbi:four-helix bundle copper-binding protein [Hazenella sp. IB182353]|uniref:four-helix bundle copper-binding protein n=1 Tax=Polycladospora coralii TaxID=2771432 RepID=UPI001746044D|nr:four-helix bundle copper-binding protein [Polycladospora coralii]MBS7528960.1 four-helix bundle copper-binding protein [Polycladospora coralii]